MGFLVRDHGAPVRNDISDLLNSSGTGGRQPVTRKRAGQPPPNARNASFAVQCLVIVPVSDPSVLVSAVFVASTAHPWRNTAAEYCSIVILG